MNPIELINLQISLEYQLNRDGKLVPFTGSSEQAIYIVYHHARGYMKYFSHLIPKELYVQLMRIGPRQAFERPVEIIHLINEGFMPRKVGHVTYWSGYFPHPPERVKSSAVIQIGESWAVEVGGQVVSRAVSARQNERCAEVFVETLPSFQKRGYGRQVVAAWAHDILNRGMIPLYSYKMSNLASAALAKSLGVQWYADAIIFE